MSDHPRLAPDELAPSFELVPFSRGLPQAIVGLFESEPSIYLTYEWFRNVAEHGICPNSDAFWGVLRERDAVLAVIPLERKRSGFGSLANCYTCLYRPLISPNAQDPQTIWSLGWNIGRYCANQPILQLDCVPSEWPFLDAFEAGVHAAGLSVRRFHQFGNWHEPVLGKSWEEYLSSRPGSLRELIRRRERQVKQRDISFEIIRNETEVERGTTAYEAIYARSWKPVEPFPRFNPELIRSAARQGQLRLGICWRNEIPIAAQLWVVANGVATVMKLAHDEEQRSLSPGTLLTARMIQQLLNEPISEIDFGRGDDAYKRLWAGSCRRRIGLLIANPGSIRGLSVLVRHDAGRVYRNMERLTTRVLHRLKGI